MAFNTSYYKHWYGIVQNRCAAWLMTHLHFWHDKAIAKRDGHLWVVRTYREFRDEHGCPYSERTIKRAVALLKEGELIEVVIAPHPFRGVLRARWFRFTEKVVEVVEWIKEEEKKGSKF